MKIRRILLSTVFLLFSLQMFSQYPFYFGKNKVMPSVINWQYIETTHFKIYHYIEKKALVKEIAIASEKAYDKISNYLNVKIKRKIPLIFYNSMLDFERTNIIGYMPPGGGALAFAEFASYRMVLQGDVAFDFLMGLIDHELAHIFEYEILGRSYRVNRPPLWILEGFSEHMRGKWDDFDLLTVRDTVLNEQIPQLQKSGEIRSALGGTRSAYNFGHAIYEFLEYKFGRRGIKKFLYSFKSKSLFRGKSDILKVFDYSPKMFNFEFGKYLRNKFRKFLTKENPADYSYNIGPDFPLAHTFSHDISPSGEMVAVLTVTRRTGTLDIVFISLKDGKVIKSITPGITNKYDFISTKFIPENGNSFTWNKDSNVIAFFARKAWTNYLILINILNGKILKKIKIKDIQEPTSPRFHPEKNMIYFVGQQVVKSHIYCIDLENGKTRKLTDNNLYIKALSISQDGRKIVFSAKENKYLKLYLAPIENPGMAKKITNGDYNDITPVFSGDGKHIYYCSSELGSYNINSIDLESKILYRYTDVRSANFFPVEIPGEKNQLVISNFDKARFSLFKKDISSYQEKRTIEFEEFDKIVKGKEEPPKEEVEILEKGKHKEVKILEKGKYKPLKKLFIKSLPPIGVSVGTDGSFLGYSYINMSDLMGDHNFSFMLYSYYGYRSYQFMYLKQNSRLQLYGRLYSFKEIYYNYYDYRNRRTISSTYGGEVGIYYPISRAFRIEATLSLYNQNDDYDSYFYGVELPYNQFFNGIACPIRLSLVCDTTKYGNYGPNRGHSFKFTVQKYLKFGSTFMNAYTLEGEIRKYIPLSTTALLAFRLYGYKSGGANPKITWTGGNNTIRTTDLYRLVGTNGFMFNAEFRFPLVHLAYTPIGPIGPVRGVFFFDVGGVWFNGQDFRIFEESKFRLKDAISSFGYGLGFFLFGYPMHVEWVWRTDLKIKSYHGVNFWIGFDF